MYYALLCAVCLISGVRLICNKAYVRRFGATTFDTYRFTFIACLVFSLGMLAVLGFRPEFTWVSFGFVAVLVALNVICTRCGFAVLAVGNLSLYTLFLNLGGMMLPFLYGILFRGDALTPGKILCLVLITAALLLQVERKGSRGWKATLCYITIFLLNGTAGICLAWHQDCFARGVAVSTESFSFLTMAGLAVASGILMLFSAPRKKAQAAETEADAAPSKARWFPWLVLALGGAFGVCFGTENYLQTLCLLHIDPSYQFPIVTGGVIVISGFAGLLFGEKITKKFVISAVLILAGTSCMLF